VFLSHLKNFFPSYTSFSLPSFSVYYRPLQYKCSHHKCAKCYNGAGSSGGILFRCVGCPIAICEDCLDQDRYVLRVFLLFLMLMYYYLDT
jgi:hypothetical protein